MGVNDPIRDLLGAIEDEARVLPPLDAFRHDPAHWRKRLSPYLVHALDLPTEFGGLGWPPMSMVRVFFALGRVSADLREVAGAQHARLLFIPQTVSSLIDDARTQVLNGVKVAVAVTEPDAAGSNLKLISSLARPVENGYELSFDKIFVGRHREARYLIVFCRQGDTEHLTPFVIDSASPELEFSDLESGGLTGMSWGRVRANRLSVGPQNILGNVGGGRGLFARHFAYWRLMNAATALGVATAATDQAAVRVCQRVVSPAGGVLAEGFGVQERLGYHIARLAADWDFVLAAASRLGESTDCAASDGCAKALCVDDALAAAQWSRRVFGASGLAENLTDLSKRVRDLELLSVASGASEALYATAGRSALQRVQKPDRTL